MRVSERANPMTVARDTAAAIRDDIGSKTRQSVAMQNPHVDASKPIPVQCAFPIMIGGQRWMASLAATKGPAFGYRWQWAVTASYPVGLLGKPQDTGNWTAKRKSVAYAICAELLRGAGDVPQTKTVVLRQGMLMVRPMTPDEIASMGNEAPVGRQIGR